MKKSYTATFKAQVVLELLKEEKTPAQISAEHGVHPNVLREWKLLALKSLPALFERRDDLAAAALAVATPLIWNSDQGSQFTTPQYTQRLLAAGVRISMDGKGRALDNSFTERFWRSLKYEEICLYDYDSPRAARHGITRYMTLYNGQRPHQALDYQTPAAVYFAPPP